MCLHTTIVVLLTRWFRKRAEKLPKSLKSPLKLETTIPKRLRHLRPPNSPPSQVPSLNMNMNPNPSPNPSLNPSPSQFQTLSQRRLTESIAFEHRALFHGSPGKIKYLFLKLKLSALERLSRAVVESRIWRWALTNGKKYDRSVGGQDTEF
jgi:hypothetical protein